MAKRESEVYYQRLAKHMVRRDRDIWQAQIDLGLDLTQEECEALPNNTIFQQCLRIERLALYNELADDPNRGKNTLIGQATFAIEKLLDTKQYDKALTGILSLAKIAGYVGADSTVNVFSNLTTQDLAKLKADLKAKKDNLPESTGTA